MKRIGIFGGTFNPIHFGHLRAALEVLEKFFLDTIFLVPSATPPHKNSGVVVNARDRLEMTRLAVSGNPVFTVSDVELSRSGLSYTIDTVSHFKSRVDSRTDLYLIMGLDAFLDLNTWKSYKRLLRSIPFIVMARPDTGAAGTKPGWNRLEEYLKTVISKQYSYSVSRSCYLHDEFQPIHIVDITLLDISSTKIRALIRDGRSISYLVPEKVDAFVKDKGLYS